jgi:hypothetical protein
MKAQRFDANVDNACGCRNPLSLDEAASCGVALLRVSLWISDSPQSRTCVFGSKFWFFLYFFC